MGRSIRFSRLRWLFALAVLLPCAVLAGIAVRSLNRESAWLEKRFQETLDAEVDHVSSLLHNELDTVTEELARSAPADATPPADEILAGWKERNPLVDLPFLLSPRFEIIWPELTTADAEERAFLNWNRAFVTDRAEIPVYQSIAQLFFEQIEELPAGGDRAVPGVGKAADAEMGGLLKESADAAAPPGEIKTAGENRIEAADSVSAEQASLREKEDAMRMRTLSQTSPSQSLSTYQQQRDAVRKLEQDESLRRQVYRQAQDEGSKTQIRNVAPRGGAEPKASNAPESIYISRPQRFSQIIAGRERGMIPRFREEALTWLYWRRLPGDRILGCVVAGAVLRERMIALIPGMLTQARVLTILDENGNPLAVPDEDVPRDWRRPVAAREISELLPRWEVAAYPADPQALASRARMTTLLMGVLILILFVTALAGGTAVLYSLRGEVELARKKTTFVANVSHELKTPLTSIRMFAEMLREGRTRDPAREAKYLDIMVSETERLTRLINNVLDFSRMDKGKRSYRMQPIDLAPFCADLVEGQKVRLEHEGFHVEFRRDPGAVWVDGDEEALKQALLNLISNAEKYSEADKRLTVILKRTAESAQIEVMDRGVGIPPADREKIFKDFYRVDESLTARARGSGLGLPIARRIVRDFGGDIRYSPREGGGSVFQIRLPLESPPLESP